MSETPGAIWHDVECGAYGADLALWEELATAAGGPVLDLGCGTGRVVLHLARRGHAVGRRRQRSGAGRVPARARRGPRGRDRARRRPRLRPRPGGRAGPGADPDAAAAAPTPRRGSPACAASPRRCGRAAASRRRSSRACPSPTAPRRPCPTCARSTAGSTPAWRSRPRSAPGEIVVHRLRQTVSPAGELSEEPNQVRIADLRRRAAGGRGGRGRPAAARTARDPGHRHPRRLDRRRAREGGLMELRVLSLYPEQMNIYADRGNIIFLAASLRVARDRLQPRRRRARRGGRPRRPRPLLHRRRPGPRPAHGRRRHGRQQARGAGGGGRRRRRHAGGLRRLPAARRTATSSATRSCRGSGSPTCETVREPGPRLIGNVAIEVDLGAGPRILAGFENHGGRTYLGAGAKPLGRVVEGHGNNGRRRLRGRPPRQPDRHLPPRPAAAQERLAGRPPDRAGAGAPLRHPARAGAARRRLRGRRPRQRPRRRRRLTDRAQRPLEPKPPSPRADRRAPRPRPARRWRPA